MCLPSLGALDTDEQHTDARLDAVDSALMGAACYTEPDVRRLAGSRSYERGPGSPGAAGPLRVEKDPEPVGQCRLIDA